MTGLALTDALQAMFVLYAALASLAALVYRGLPRSEPNRGRARSAPLAESKGDVYTLAALFSLDAFGGGFVVQSMLALWLYQRFDLSLGRRPARSSSGPACSSAFSYLVAVRIANRIGLVNTMVFTHLPSNLLPDR